MELTTAARELFDLQEQLERQISAAKIEEARLRQEIKFRIETLQFSRVGIDANKVKLAKTIITVGTYENGGKDVISCIDDAIKQLSTGQPVRKLYGDLWKSYFGTKNYDGWRGQRCDCEYGFGPRHGDICFRIEITKDVRKLRNQEDLSAEEIEAAIYYLTNIDRIQKSEKASREASDAA